MNDEMNLPYFYVVKDQCYVKESVFEYEGTEMDDFMLLEEYDVVSPAFQTKPEAEYWLAHIESR